MGSNVNHYGGGGGVEGNLYLHLSSTVLLFFCRLISSHPALVNAIILVLHSVAGSIPPQASAGSSRNVSAGSYSDMPGEESMTVKG